MNTPARRVPTFDDITQAGDYCLGSVEDHGVSLRHVWFLLPIHAGDCMYDRPSRGSGLHGVSEPPWVFRECDDGSLEIRESIACGRQDIDPGTKEPLGEYWHGYLDEGNIWRTV